MKTNFNLTSEEMNLITSLTEDLVKSAESSKSVKDNVVSLLTSRVVSISNEMAKSVAADLLKGVTDFTGYYEELCKADDGENKLFERCMEQIADRTPQEQVACILNFMALLKTLDSTVLGEMLNDVDADVVARFEEFKSLNPQVSDAITEEELQEMKEQLRDAIEHNTVCIVGDKQMEELVQALDINPELAKNLTEKGLKELDYKVYAALAAYIAYKKGQLKSLPEEEIDAELLGASVAAGIERSKIITGAKKGWISWEKAFMLLKMLGGALLLLLFAWVNIHLLVLGVELSCGLLSALVGSGVIGLLAGIIIGGYSMYKALSWFYDNVEEGILNELGIAYDKVIAFFTESNFIASIRKSLQRFWTFISEKVTLLFKLLTVQKDQIIIGR